MINQKLLILTLFLLAFFLRFYKLSSYPVGLYQDETAIGYNAYSILKTGKDEHNIRYPLYFKSFGDYKMPVYIYLTALAIKFFGVNAFSVRFFSAFFGVLSIVILYFYLKENFSQKLAMLGSFLLTFNPWHLFFSRAALEVNVATTFSLLGLFFFQKAINKKAWFYQFISFLFFVLSVYTYNVSRVIAPLIFLSLIFLNRKVLFKHFKIQTFAIFFLFCLLILPLIIASFLGQGGTISQTGELLIGGHSLASVIEFRSHLISLPSFIYKLLFNNFALISIEYLKNLLNFVSPQFFFTLGDVEGHFGVSNFGMFYPFEIVTIAVGLFIVIKKKLIKFYSLLGWLFIVIVVVSFNKITPHSTRAYMMIISMVVFSALGLNYFFERIKKKKIIYLLFILFFAYFFIYWMSSYLFYFPVTFASKWRSEDRKIIKYVTNNALKYDLIVFDRNTNFVYTSFLFYSHFDPAYFQKNAAYEKDGMLIRLRKIGKYEFRDLNWSKDAFLKKALIITRPENIPMNMTSVKIFNYPTRPVVTFFDEKFGQYPTTDIAYELYETK